MLRKTKVFFENVKKDVEVYNINVEDIQQIQNRYKNDQKHTDLLTFSVLKVVEKIEAVIKNLMDVHLNILDFIIVDIDYEVSSEENDGVIIIKVYLI